MEWANGGEGLALVSRRVGRVSFVPVFIARALVKKTTGKKINQRRRLLSEQKKTGIREVRIRTMGSSVPSGSGLHVQALQLFSFDFRVSTLFTRRSKKDPEV